MDQFFKSWNRELSLFDDDDIKYFLDLNKLEKYQIKDFNNWIKSPSSYSLDFELNKKNVDESKIDEILEKIKEEDEEIYLLKKNEFEICKFYPSNFNEIKEFSKKVMSKNIDLFIIKLIHDQHDTLDHQLISENINFQFIFDELFNDHKILDNFFKISNQIHQLSGRSSFNSSNAYSKLFNEINKLSEKYGARDAYFYFRIKQKYP